MKKSVDQLRMPGDLLAAIKTRPQQEIEDLFQSLKIQACLRLPACQSDDDRRNLQAETKAIDTIKQFFLSEMQRK